MKWFTAHIIMYTKFKDGNQDKFPVWENVVLIESNTPEEAYQKAKLHGEKDEGDSLNTYFYEDRPATWVFAGIRKLIDCEDITTKLDEGIEITYSSFEIKDEGNLKKLVDGEPVILTYLS